MDVEVRLAWRGDSPAEARPGQARLGRKITAKEPGLKSTTLPHLFRSLGERHPELAPILENALEAPDLEIKVNDHLISGAEERSVVLRDGDKVALFIHRA